MRGRRVAIRNVLAGAAALCFVILGAARQEPEIAAGTRLLLQTTKLDGIDRGLRDNDPPGEPRGARGRIDSAGSELSYVPGRVIVKFLDDSDAASAQSVAQSFGATVTPRSRYANFDILAIPVDDDPEVVARALGARPDVDYAQAAYRMHPQFKPNDPLYPVQWNLPVIDMERAWDIQPDAASSVVVAVLDTGVTTENAIFRFNTLPFNIGPIAYPSLGVIDVPVGVAPDLASANRFVAPMDFIWGDTMPADFDGHGTHVAGTIGQLTNNNVGPAGVAFNVRIMPIKVLSGNWEIIFGNPTVGTDDIVAQATRYAVDNGAKVLNMSFGRNGGPAPVIEDALRYAVSKGAFVAIAGGNGFESGNQIHRPADIAERIDGVVAVAAIARDKTRAFFSSTGSYIELAAPGGDQRRFGTSGGVVQQTIDNSLAWPARLDMVLPPSEYRPPRFDAYVYEFFQGTSMATPHVAGLAALLMQQGITSPAAIEAAMKRFAEDLGAAGRDDEFGVGLIRARETLHGLGLAR